jgi:hypothetical protein
MSKAKNQAAEAVTYLSTRLRFLRACYVTIHNQVEDDKIRFINPTDERTAQNEYLWNIDTRIVLTFRYSMMIAACTFLEEALKLTAKLALPTDYQQKLKTLKNGTWLLKHRRLFERETAADLSLTSKHWELMEEFVEIRNCIAHAWGNSKECKNANRVSQIVSRSEYFEQFKDGYLWVHDHAVPAAHIASERILRSLFKQLFGVNTSWPLA